MSDLESEALVPFVGPPREETIPLDGVGSTVAMCLPSYAWHPTLPSYSNEETWTVTHRASGKAVKTRMSAWHAERLARVFQMELPNLALDGGGGLLEEDKRRCVAIAAAVGELNSPRTLEEMRAELSELDEEISRIQERIDEAESELDELEVERRDLLREIREMEDHDAS